LYIAPLSLLIACELLLFGLQQLLPLPAWLHLSALIAAAAGAVALCAVLRKREDRALAGLHREIAGMQHQVAMAACRYQGLLEGAGNAILVLNAQNGEVEEANLLGAELLGFSREELARLPGRDLLHPAEQQKFDSFLEQLKTSGSADLDGVQIRKRDGSLFLGEINARLIDLGDRQLVHCILRDITEKRRTEREIWQRNRELSILNDILSGVNRVPQSEGVQEGTLVEIMELFRAGGGTVHLVGADGAPPKTCVARQVSDHLAGLISASIARATEKFREVRVLGQEAGEGLLMSAAAEGWHCVTSIPLASQGQLIGVVHLMHALPHGYTREELRFLASVGKQLGNVIEESRLFAELNWKTEELLRSHRLLEKTSHSLSVSEIKLKRNLALVEQAHLDLSRLDRMKNQFLGMVSHEFNTPLTSIISGSDYLLQQGWGTREGGEVLLMVRDGGLRLKELVADLLKLIKLEARAAELQTSAIHLQRFMESLKHQLKPQLKKRKQTVRLTDLDSLPYFDGDRNYLERLFGELLLNAIKFSPDGAEIEVTGRVVDKKVLSERRETLDRFNPDFLKRCGNRCYLQVEVRDHGIGIPVEEQQGIFEIFYEVAEIRHHSSGSSRLQGKGAGLGLAIVKGMVEAHGGMVWVESNSGSSFFLVLPLEQEASQATLF
jgi:PAS domain S-box-containing protein